MCLNVLLLSSSVNFTFKPLVSLYLSISYMSKSEPNSNNDKLNKIIVFLDFQDIGVTHGYSEAIVDIEVVNCENEARNIYSEIMGSDHCPVGLEINY